MTAHKYKPLISVIIPTYNRLELLTQAVQSVLLQTLECYEILIIDDGSTEPIQSLESLDSKVKVIRHPANQGISAARNTGIQAAAGKYIAFLDSDDEWLPKKLEAQAGWMEKNPDVRATTTGFHYLTEEEQHITIPRNRRDWPRHFSKGLDLGPGATLMAHTSCMREFPFDPALPRMADLDWVLRFSQKYPLHVIEEPLAVVHRNSRPSADKVEQSNLLLIERYRALFYQYGRFFGSQCVGKRYLEIATHFFREGNRQKGFRYLKNCVLKNPFQRPSMYLRIVDYLLGTNTLVSIKNFRQQIKS